MSKLILFLSFLGLGILLLFGLFAPDNAIMWLASTTASFAWLRAGMMLILFGLLVSNPPRNVYFRGFVGVASVLLVSWSLKATYNNQLGLLDSLSLLQAGIAAGLTVLERNYNDLLAMQAHAEQLQSNHG